MTTDIVERLRAENSVVLAFGQDLSDLLLSAANEIERLQKRCDTLEQLLQPNPEALYRLAMGRKITEDRA